MPRTQLNVRVPETTLAQIKELQRLGYESQSHTIIVAIDRLHTQETAGKMELVNDIEYFRCGTGNLGQALAAYLVAQHAGHRIERNGVHYYHNAAFSFEMYQAYAAEIR